MTQIKEFIKGIIPEQAKIKYRQSKEAKALREWTPDDAARFTLYQAFLKEGDLVFDIGANLGNRTKVFRRLGAKVVAVEPQPRCWNVLRAAYSNDVSVNLVQEAVGRQAGQITMYLNEHHYLSSVSAEWLDKVRASGRFGSTTWDQTIRVSVTTLDTLIESYGQPSFIKIDVEGHELEVLNGLRRCVKTLSFEFAPEAFSTASSCAARLGELGMKEFNFVEGESTRLVFEKWLTYSEIMERLSAYKNSNSVFGDIYARCSNA